MFYVRIAKKVGRDTKESIVGKAWAEFDQRLDDLAGQIRSGLALSRIDAGPMAQHWEVDLTAVAED